MRQSRVQGYQHDIWEFLVLILLSNLTFFLHSSISCTHQNTHQSWTNPYNSALLSFLLWFLVILLGAKSPGEPGQTCVFLSVSVSVWSHSFLHNIFSFPLNSKLLLLPSVRLPRVVSSSVCSKVSRWDKNPRQIQSYLFSHFIVQTLFVHRFSFSLRNLLHSNDTNSRKTSAAHLLYKEYQTDNENLTSGRAFAFSSLFPCQSSDLLPLCLFICLPLLQFVVQLVFLLVLLFTDRPLHRCAYYTP